ncbi:flagellar basal-body rod protein FlgG [Acetitomaculum ruminis DSM 5522]|uniref:Flagellar basal-body rod protein FlgG n=1 Tax=Acetitomaculum ruminis DSM 5522 TaxID=1120918 RepID=A0A1I0YHZ5_9FIRM|nr:flagellar hook-basal body protein [Acetitomaculum ruminis]SFB12954.1 flagellar basal-body rod protein FlgG [Acetitomaculum ruminis DSM 5522]
MVKGLYTAYTGMIYQMKKMDVLTNNLANADTTGFKKEGTTQIAFDEVLAVKIKDSSDYNLAKGIGDISLGTKIGQTYRDYSQGAYEVTDNTYDLAIDGNGFFAVSFTNKAGQSSIKYTRDGAFTLTKEGYLVTKDGDFVLNRDAALSSNGNVVNGIPQGAIRLDTALDTTIESSGEIYQNGNLVGTIGLIDFADYNYLEKYGENMYQPVAGATVIDSNARIDQGNLERSNINVVSEMVDMIQLTRAYETNQKVITTIDETLDKAVNSVGAL